MFVGFGCKRNLERERYANYSCQQEFNFGVEFVLLLSFVDSASGHVEEALVSLEELIVGFPSLIVQSTRGLLELKAISLYFSLFGENNSLEP